MRLKFLIKEAKYNLRKRIQRFKHGYSDEDVWNMDTWFVETIIPMLHQLKTRGIGTPAYLTEDEWHDILDQMLNHLYFMNEDNVVKFLGLYPYPTTTEDYKRINEILLDHKNKFFELFSKYFYDLWD